MRAYAATKAVKDRHDHPKQKSAMWQLVERIEAELAAEAMGIALTDGN